MRNPEQDDEQQDEPDIPPALSADEWAAVRNDKPTGDGPLDSLSIDYTNGDFATGSLSNPFGPIALIALLNDALNDDDVRKIRREHVEMLRAVAKELDDAQGGGDDRSLDLDLQTRLANLYSELHELADALESYLPPVEAKAPSPTDGA